jgi:hypothetical protein
VYTVAISEDNPEYVAAHARGIPCVSRADYLGALMTGYTRRVGVAGMHGKSTCTSMCAQILLDARVDPTILSGAAYAPMGGAYRLGESKEHFLFEACDYMDSFLDFHPTVAVLLGAELEHVDYFKDMEQITESFARFASLTGEEGVTVVNLDDEDILESARRALERGMTGRLITFSADGDPAADFTARNIRAVGGLPCFDLLARGELVGQVAMAVPGKHQVINALAAADGIVIPMPCDFYSLEGLSQLNLTIKKVRSLYNPALDITGILLTMYNKRLLLTAQVEAELQKYYADKLFRQTISRSVKLAEAPGFGRPICYFDPYGKGSLEYRDVVKELLLRV